MVISCGIDTEEIFRFRKHINDFSDSLFVKTILSEREIENYKLFPLLQCLPLSFCCKEAVFKALGESWTTCPITWKDIELIFNKEPLFNDFQIVLNNYALTLYDRMNVTNTISSYNIKNDYVTFEIILVNDKN